LGNIVLSPKAPFGVCLPRPLLRAMLAGTARPARSRSRRALCLSSAAEREHSDTRIPVFEMKRAISLEVSYWIHNLVEQNHLSFNLLSFLSHICSCLIYKVF